MSVKFKRKQMTILFLPLIGVFIGFISGFFGIGGGTILVPILIFLGYDTKIAIGISILQMLMSSAFGSFLNYKNGKFKLNEGIIVGLGGLAGAGLSGFIASRVSSLTLEIGLIVALMIAIIKLFNSNLTSKPKNPPKYILLLVGFVVAMLAISMGVGGAIFLTPILVGFLGVDIKKSISMGLFFVLFSSTSGFISFWLHNLIDFKNGIFIAIPSIFGVYAGIKLSAITEKRLHKQAMLIMYLLLLGLMIYKVCFK